MLPAVHYEVSDLNLRDPELLLRCAAISRFHAASRYGQQEHRAGQGRKTDGNDLEQHAHLRKRLAKRACSIGVRLPSLAIRRQISASSSAL